MSCWYLAQKKGANNAAIGLVIGMFDVALASSAFGLAIVNSPQTQKFFYLSGMGISATSVALFGTLAYGPGGSIFIGMWRF